jgi:hypothetical protein
MDNEQLIQALMQDYRPVPRSALALRLVLGAGVGLMATVAVVALVLGIRADIGDALTTFPFWMKWAYVLMLGIGALVGIGKIARPDATDQPWLWVLSIPVAAMAILATMQALQAPAGAWSMQWMGKSWDSCPVAIAALSVPIFAGLMFAFRQFAPTRLRLAGFLAGLASGSLAAFAYVLYCPETSAVFVVIWYSAGIAIPAVLGALIGPRLLKW